MSTRDQLNNAIYNGLRKNHQKLMSSVAINTGAVADHLLSQGWRPPMRVISTVEELEKLPEESAVVDHMGEIHVKASLLGGFCETWGEEKRSAERMFREIGCPFLVVWEPEVKA